MNADHRRPLEGFTVAVTADRKRAELATLLERKGARVVGAPAVSTLPVDTAQLRAAILRCLDAPITHLIVTTAMGLRAIFEAADAEGLGDRLRSHLAWSEVITRGSKAHAAARAVGLPDASTPASETMREVMAYLHGLDLRGARIVVQLHGEPLTRELDTLRAAGAEVVAVPVYRWAPPARVEPARRMIELTVRGEIDAVAFTSAPAAEGLLRIADGAGMHAALLEAMRTTAVTACIGAVCAAPLERAGVTPVLPDRSRLADLVRAIGAEVPKRRSVRLNVGGLAIEVRGHCVVFDEKLVEVSPAPMAILRALARQPGRVVGREELLRVLPGRAGATPHAVEMAVNRLRALLADPKLVQTVVKRGYRLAVARQA